MLFIPINLKQFSFEPFGMLETCQDSLCQHVLDIF